MILVSRKSTTVFAYLLCMMALCSCAANGVTTSHPSESDGALMADYSPTLERAGWMHRAQVPEAIAQVRIIREYVDWCLYEGQQPEPLTAPCMVAMKKLDAFDEVREEARQLRLAIRTMKHAPPSAVLEDHMLTLQGALDEITHHINAAQESIRRAGLTDYDPGEDTR